jgi:hypothetical protein
MQIPEDDEPLPLLKKKVRPRTTTIEELALRNVRQDDTVRISMSAIAFWREPENPELDTVRVRLNLPEDPDDEVTVAAPLTLPD